MIRYSLDSSLRYYLYVSVLMLSLTINYVISTFFSSYFSATGSGITTVSLAGIMLYVIDKFLWKYPNKIGAELVADFSGNWYGYVRDRSVHKICSGDSNSFTLTCEPNFPVRLKISQTFSEIGIWLTDDNKLMSECVVAGTENINVQHPRLRYIFLFENKKGEKIRGEAFLELNRDSSEHVLTGKYSSSSMAKADLIFKRKTCALQTITVEKIQNKNEIYIGATIRKNDISDNLNKFKKIVGKTKFETFEDNRHMRDGENYHLTIVTPSEYEGLGEKERELATQFLNERAWVETCAIGHRKKNENETYFVICNSELLNEFRKSLGLSDKDFHITLGFDKSDVHSVRKDISTKVENRLLKVFKR